jgi:hypothetical protein
VKSEDDVKISNKPNAPKISRDATFGETARPSTPMWEILEHKYAKTWKEEVKARELMIKEMQQSVRQKIAPKKGEFHDQVDDECVVIRVRPKPLIKSCR